METGLSKHDLIAFVPVTDFARAKAFYGDKLGLRLVTEEPPYALVFNANGIMLRLTLMKERPPNVGTVLGWQVPEAAEAVGELAQRGVNFEIYGFLEQDRLGIWITPTGAKVAWFKDPDGNTLSISEHPEWKP